MKKSRRSFLAVVASGAGMSLASLDAKAATPSPSPAPSPPSSEAEAVAMTMRKFDPALTDDDLQTIAKAIDANNTAARALNPKKKRLKNSEGPAVQFVVSEA